MLPKEVEHLLGIEVQSVVVSRGVFEVAETLAHVLPTQRVSGGGAFRTEHWRPTRIPLNPVDNYVGVRESGRVVEVVVAPSPGSIEQPGRGKRAVVASSNVAGSVLKFIEGCSRRCLGTCVSIGVVIAIGRVAEGRALELVVVVQPES